MTPKNIRMRKRILDSATRIKHRRRSDSGGKRASQTVLYSGRRDEMVSTNLEFLNRVAPAVGHPHVFPVKGQIEWVRADGYDSRQRPAQTRNANRAQLAGP